LTTRRTKVTPASTAAEVGVRQGRLLDAAVATFVRYGFRKTSMEEVARAAHLSRQALYLHFATKEELFGAAVRRALSIALAAATAALRQPDVPLEARLLAAFDAWVGQHTSLAPEGVADLEETSARLLGPIIPEHEARFVEAIATALHAVKLPPRYREQRISERQLAEVLLVAAHGLKPLCRSPIEFGERFTIVVRAICLPLLDASR
jgi:TetR/AcrR family transcriptional regulator of autoinduction and epiphytic fitness